MICFLAHIAAYSHFGNKMPAFSLEEKLSLIGPSGCGKSSFVFAGLLPRLHYDGTWCINEFHAASRKPASSPRKAATAKQGTLDERPTIHVPFNRSIAVWKKEGRFPCFIIFLQTLRKRFPIGKTTALASLEPEIKRRNTSLFHAFHTTASQVRPDCNEWGLSHEGEGALLLLVQSGWVSEQKPDQMARCFPCDRWKGLVCGHVLGLRGSGAGFLLLGETQQLFCVQSVLAAWLFSPWGSPPSDLLVAPRETWCHQFLPERVGMATSLRQPFFPREKRGMAQTVCAQHRGSLRKSSSGGTMANRASAQTEVVSASSDTHRLLGEGDDLFLTGLPSEASNLRGRHFGVAAPTLVSVRLRKSERLVPSNPFRMQALEGSCSSVPSVGEHRKAISDWSGRWRTIAGTTSLFRRGVPAPNEHTGRGSQPRRKRLCRSVGKEVHRASGPSISQDRARGAATPTSGGAWTSGELASFARRQRVSPLTVIPIGVSRREPVCPLNATAKSLSVVLKRFVGRAELPPPPGRVRQRLAFGTLDADRENDEPGSSGERLAR